MHPPASMQPSQETWPTDRNCALIPFTHCASLTCVLDRDESAAAKLWAVYISEAEKYDRALVESWRNDMDGLLIFVRPSLLGIYPLNASPIQAGLFSASLTAFLIESYKTLNVDSGDATVRLLTQISQQLAASANGTTYHVSPAPTFTPTGAAVVCNALWFLSLGLSLSCALIATLVEQWARDFTQKTELRSSPIIRARIFSYLYYGLRRFKMHAVVELIPLLLHISLILFFAGLVAFLLPVNNTAITAIAAVLLFVIFSVYSYLTVLPIFHSDCPYRTPLSGPTRYLFLRASRVRIPSFARQTKSDEELAYVNPTTLIPSYTTLTEVMIHHATRCSPERADRDGRALIWTVKSLTDDGELEPFVEGVFDVIWGPTGLRRLYDDQISTLLCHPDVRLLSRIKGLLRTCESGLLSPTLQHRRQISAFKAIWSIGQLGIESEEPFHGLDFAIFEPVEKFDLTVQHYVHSAKALARYNVLCWYQRKILSARNILQAFHAKIVSNGLILPNMTDIVCSIADLIGHATKAAVVLPFAVDHAGFLQHRSQLPSPEYVLRWTEELLQTLRVPHHEPLLSFLKDVSWLDSPPYEFEKTCNAMIGDASTMSPNDIPSVESALRSFDLDRLRAHSGVHNIDIAVGVLTHLWQQMWPQNLLSLEPTLSTTLLALESTFYTGLLRYIHRRESHETLATALGRCDHRRLTLNISSCLGNLPAGYLASSTQVLEGLWRLCVFYLKTHADPSRTSTLFPLGFDEQTILAVQTQAPPNRSSIIVLIRILMLRSEEQASLSHSTTDSDGSTLCATARGEAYWLAMVDFLEHVLHCASATKSTMSSLYKPVETFFNIYNRRSTPPLARLSRATQVRFDAVLMDLWWNHSIDIPIVNELIAQIAIALLDDRNGTGIYRYFDDPGALSGIEDLWGCLNFLPPDYESGDDLSCMN